MLLITSGEIPTRFNKPGPRSRGRAEALAKLKADALKAVWEQDLERHGYQVDDLGTQTAKAEGRVRFMTKISR